MKPSVSYVVRLVVNEVMKEVVNKPGGFDIPLHSTRTTESRFYTVEHYSVETNDAAPGEEVSTKP